MLPKNDRGWNPPDDEFLTLYENGASQRELGDHYDVAQSTIYGYVQFLIKKGVIKNRTRAQRIAEVVRKAKIQARSDVDSTDTFVQSVFEHIKRGNGKRYSILELAEAFDCSPNRVRKAVDDMSDLHYLVKHDVEADKIAFAPDPGGKGIFNLEELYGDCIRFGVVSDMHLGSQYQRLDLLHHTYDVFERAHVKTVFLPGNWCEGDLPKINGNELLVHGFEGQLNYVVANYPKKEGMTTYFIDGDDHEGWWRKDIGVIPGKRLEHTAKENGREDLVYLGYAEADVLFPTDEGATVVRVQHPGGGSAYATSYIPQKIIESLSAHELPDFLILGHYHKYGYFKNRGIHVLLSGCLQEQSMFMRKHRLAAHLGATIVHLYRDKTGRITRAIIEPLSYDTPDHRAAWRIPAPVDVNDIKPMIQLAGLDANEMPS